MIQGKGSLSIFSQNTFKISGDFIDSTLRFVKRHGMDNTFIYTLSKTLDPKLKWGIKTTDIVTIANRKTGKNHCAHQFPPKTIVQWLERKPKDEDLCYFCQGNDKMTMRLPFENLAISAKKKRKVEKKDVRRIDPPSYIKKAIEEHYRIVKEKDIPNFVAIWTDKWFFGDAILAMEKLDAKFEIGLYTGTPIFTKKEILASTSDKIFDIEIWGNTVGIDGNGSWTSLINHKWMFPEECRENYDKAWDEFFANCIFRESGKIQTIRAVKDGEQLFIDYGKKFWGEEEEEEEVKKPLWDLRKAPESLLKEIERCERLTEFKNASEIITDPSQKKNSPEPFKRHEMDTPFIFTLSETLDPELEWGIKPADIVTIANRKTGKDYCTHQFPKKTIVQWLEHKTEDEDLCYFCQGNDKTAMRLSFENLTINANEKKGKEEVEEVTRRPQPPKYIKDAIKDHFNPQNRLIDKNKFYIRETVFGRGVFAKDKIPAERNIGFYSGVPIWAQEDLDAPPSDKVIDIKIWGNTISIDGKGSWTSLINHKWMFPEECEENYDKAWDKFFANCIFKEGGKIVALRKIKKNDQLFIDYGKNFWKNKPPPFWDLTDAPENLLKAIDECNELKELKVSGGTESDPMIIDKKVDL